jgi:hypothetical protein
MYKDVQFPRVRLVTSTSRQIR